MEYPVTMRKTRAEMTALGLPGGRKKDAAIVVSNTIAEQDRWTTTYDLIFRLPGMPDHLAYSTWYRQGSTEQQDEAPWEHEPADCVLVQAVTVTRIEWMPVDPATPAPK